MKLSYCHPDPAFVVETALESLLSDGAGLNVITLDKFKERLTQTIHWMVEEYKATKSWPHRDNPSQRSVAV